MDPTNLLVKVAQNVGKGCCGAVFVCVCGK